MTLIPYIVQRRRRLYLRVRAPADIAALSGRTHITRTLRTAAPRKARAEAAQLLAVVHRQWGEARRMIAATVLGKPISELTDEEIFQVTPEQIQGLPTQDQARFLDALDLAGQRTVLEARRLEVEAQEQAAQTQRLANAMCGLETVRRATQLARRQHTMLSQMQDVATDRSHAASVADAEATTRAEFMAMFRVGMAEMRELKAAISISTSAAQQAVLQPEPGVASAAANVPWNAYLEAFYRDKPDLGDATRASYGQAFRAFGGLFPDKLLSEITKADIKQFCDHLRDRPIKRAGRETMARDSIVKLLGHLRGYLAWTVSAGHLPTGNPADGVQPRAENRQERMDRDKRRAFSATELTKLFDSPLFTGFLSTSKRAQPGTLHYRDEPFWFFALAALTGARTEEIAELPAQFVKLGDVECFDLRHASKTAAGPRLIPVLPDLWRMGLRQWAADQQRRGRGMVQGPEASDDWSKWSNRYLVNIGLKAPGLVTYSLRHSFRQALRAAGLHEELADKVFGHEGKSVGAGYGRDLAPAEAKLVVERVKFPVPLDHLFIPRSDY